MDAHFEKVEIPKTKFTNARQLLTEITSVFNVYIKNSDLTEDEIEPALGKACNICGIYSNEDYDENASMSQFMSAVKKVSYASPLIKGKLIKALVKIASYNGEVTMLERNVIFSIALAIDSPVPMPLMKALNEL